MRRLEERVRELERLLGRKTMEVKILKEPLAKSKKTELAAVIAAEAQFPMKVVADTLGVAHSYLHDRVRRLPRLRRRYSKSDAAALLPLIRLLVSERPTYGYRRITVLANRELVATGKLAVNRKRVFRIMRQSGILLPHHSGRQLGCVHDGKVIVMRSNLRWCSDGFEMGCWNGEVVRAAFIIDAHDHEAIARHGVAGSGTSGSNVRDRMLKAVKKRFGAVRAPQPHT